MNERRNALDLIEALTRVSPAMAELSGLDTFVIVSAIQLACCHPEVGGPVKEQLWRIGHELAELFAPVPAVADLVRRGWDRAYDVPSAPAGGGRT